MTESPPADVRWTHSRSLLERSRQSLAGGYGIAVGSVRVISPTRSMSATEFGRISAQDAQSLTAQDAALAPEYEATTSITISLDGVFFAHGSYIGQDKSDFFLQTLCDMNARHDAGVSVLRAIASGISDADLPGFFTRYQAEDASYTANTRHDSYWHMRGQVSAQLGDVFAHFGRSALVANATRLAQEKQLKLFKARTLIGRDSSAF